MKCWWLVLALAGCTRPNPAVCCLDLAACETIGLSELRDCSTGLACVENHCVVPSCSVMGCEAATPVCNTTTDVCELCTNSSQCTQFADAAICDKQHGTCVGCLDANDCPTATPVCDAKACRTCALDLECSTGACGDDGACIAEGAIVYMDVSGTDTGTCSRSKPCRRLGYAVSQTSVERPHVVMNKGEYVDTNIVIEPQSTTAPTLFIHGSGSTFSAPTFNDDFKLALHVPARIRNLTFFNGLGLAADSFGTSSGIVVGEHLIFIGGDGLETQGTVELRDVIIEQTQRGLRGSGNLTIDRAIVRNSGYGITATTPVTVSFSNLLVHNINVAAIDLPMASGTISFATLIESGGYTGGAGPLLVRCGTLLTIRSSIVWRLGISTRAPVEGGCALVSTIAGPTPVPPAMNVNPMFVDVFNDDYRLAPNSPARDAVDDGPAQDYEGDARPRGVRFDIGADEAP